MAEGDRNGKIEAHPLCRGHYGVAQSMPGACQRGVADDAEDRARIGEERASPSPPDGPIVERPGLAAIRRDVMPAPHARE
ncbi:hypothetical protein GCM10025759_05950 [Lysobacter panacisoli]|uniref:Uncharacterized protein n=1 Tax=Lysobacter panacisoli TaxID=1255263 RepID=A0ABP9L1A6_9GAMM